MEEEIKEKALEGVDGFFTKLTEAADIVSAKLVDVAPEAAEAVLNLVQFKGVFDIGVGAVLALLSFVSVKKLLIPGCQKLIEDEYCGIGLVMAMFGGAAAFITGLFSLIQLLTFYIWLSAFYPEGAIALKALQAVGVDL